MNELNRGRKNGTKKKSRVWLSMLSIVTLFVVTGSFFIAQAFENEKYGAEHTISYTEAQLVALLEKAIEEPVEPDYSLIASNKGDFALDESLEYPQDVWAGDTQVEWVRAQMEGHLLIDTFVEEDGCVAYVALQLEKQELTVIGINPNGETHAYNLHVEKNEEIPVEMEGYSLAPVITEKEPAATVEENPVVENNANEATSETVSELQSQPTEEISKPISETINSEPVKDETVEEEADKSAEEGNIVETPTLHFNFLRNLYSTIASEDTSAIIQEDVKMDESDSSQETMQETIVQENSIPPVIANEENKEMEISSFSVEQEYVIKEETVKKDAKLAIPANGMGVAQLNIGVLSAGPLPQLKLNSSSKVVNTLEIHSGPTGNFALWSEDKMRMYSINESTDIVVSSRGNGKLNIELKNTSAVNIRSIDITKLTASGNEFAIYANVPDATLNVQTNTGIAINGNDGKILIAGRNGYSAKLNVSGASNAVYMKSSSSSSLVVDNGSELNVKAHGKVIECSSMGVLNKSTVTVNGLKMASDGILLSKTLYADNLSYINVYDVTNGITCETIMAKDGTQSYANESSRDDEKRTRIIAVASNIGLKVSKDTVVRSGALVLGEGGDIGLQGIVYNDGHSWALDHPLAHSSKTISGNSTIGMSDFKIELGNLKYGTIIALGTGSNGVGFSPTTDSGHQCFVSHALRMIAKGEKYGYHTNEDIDLRAYYFGEIIAVGGEAGVYLSKSSGDNVVHTDFGGKLYAYGKTYGVRVAYGKASSFGTSNNYSASYQQPWQMANSRFVAIGGIDPKDMTGNFDPTKSDAVYANVFDELQLPITDEQGLVPLKEKTYGVWIESGDALFSYIAAYDQTTVMKLYGGEFGGRTGRDDNKRGTYIVAYEGGYLEAHGGNYGLRANSYVHVWSRNPQTTSLKELAGNSTMKGYGKKVGIEAMGKSGCGYITTHTGHQDVPNSMGRSYIYGYGEEVGIRAQEWVMCEYGATIIGETVTSEKAAAGTTEAQPAIISGKNTLLRRHFIESEGLVHEIYNISDLEIKNPPAYQINKKIQAIATNIGTDPTTLQNFVWTTPKNPLAPSPTDGRDWMNYDSTDDQKIISVGMSGNQLGLLASKSIKGVTIVANSNRQANGLKHVGNACVQAGLCCSKGDNITGVGGPGTYRMTIRGKETKPTNLDTMNVEIDLWDRLYKSDTTKIDTDITSVPNHVKYQLEYVSLSSGTRETVDLAGNQVKNGIIKLTKLIEGDYYLKPVTQWGTPYKDLPTIHFAVEHLVHPPFDFLLVTLPDSPTNDAYVSVIQATEELAAGSGTGVPTFPGQLQDPDDNAKYAGKLRVYYQKENILKVKIEAKGLWTGHNTPSFVIQMKGISGKATGTIYYDYVSILANESYETYKNRVLTRDISLEGMPDGKYEVTVMNSLRTMPQNASTATQIVEYKDSQVTNNDVVFPFVYGRSDSGNIEMSYIYLSGEDADKNTFVVN